MWWVQTKVHNSWLIALVCLFFVCGTALALVIRITWWWGIVAIALIFIGFWLRYCYILPVIALGGLVVGLGYGSAHLGARDAYTFWMGKTVQLQGRIKEDPAKTSSGATSLQLDTVHINDNAMPGSVYVSIRGSPEVKRGDIVKVAGEAEGGFGNFPISVSAFKIDSIIRPVPGDIGRVVRDWFAEKVRVLIPEPQASLGIGFLTGQKSALPEDLSDA